MKPVYEMAVMNVRCAFPKAQDARVSSGDARFRDALYAILWREHSLWIPDDGKAAFREDFDESWQEDYRPPFIPDLWWIDEENRTIHLFEIEDTHPLTQEKMLQLHDFWWLMDGEKWLVKVTVFDRYGLNARTLDLTTYAYHMLQVFVREEQEERKVGEPGATDNPDGAQGLREGY